MKAVLAIVKRELGSYFTSPMLYIITAVFSALAGWIFFNLLAGYVTNTQNLPEALVGQVRFVDAVVIKFFGNLNFMMLLVCPLISMRLFSEEKKQNSIDLLFSAPISDWSIVIGKYLSSFFVVIFMLSLTFIFPIILHFSGLFEERIFFSGYVGLTANIMAYLAIGIFASSTTENQIVAALMSMVTIMFLWLTSWAAQVAENYMMSFFLHYVGLVSHFQNVVRGIFSSIDVIYYLSFIVLFLFSTKKVLESRNW